MWKCFACVTWICCYLCSNDFVLVGGDVVSNVDLAPAVAAHRARREKDKNAIMTLVSFC